MTKIHKAPSLTMRPVRCPLSAALVTATAIGVQAAQASTASAVAAAQAGSISGFSLSVSSEKPPYTVTVVGATNQHYQFDFQTSPTGTLAAGSGTVTITTAPGTNLGGNNCSNPSALRGQGVTIMDFNSPTDVVHLPCPSGNSMTFTVPFNIAGGDTVQVNDYSVTNPSTAGAHTATISSSADGPATTTYNIGLPVLSGIGQGIFSIVAVLSAIWNCGILKQPTGCPL